MSSIHWHSTWQRHQELARLFAQRGLHVVFLEPIPKRWPSWREASRVWGRLVGGDRGGGTCSQPVPPGVDVSSSLWAPDSGRLGRWINRVHSVGRAADRLNGLPRPWLLWHTLPVATAVALQQRLRPEESVYDCVRDWQHAPLVAKTTLREFELAASVDGVVVDSPRLLRRWRGRNRPVGLVPPAVHYDDWAPARQHHSNATPRCAYFGTVGPHVDLELLARVAERHALRVIGPAPGGLGSLANRAEWLGPVPAKGLPRLLADVDVLLLPYRATDHNRAVVPAKLFECLATGKPTVALGLEDAREVAPEVVYCDSAEGFLNAIDTALADPSKGRERRLDAAQRNSWQQRMAEIDEHLVRWRTG